MGLARQFTVFATEGSKVLLARAEKRTPGGVHSNVRLTARPAPLFFERASGVYLYDVDGNRYVDFVLGQGPMFLGHGHPSVTEAVKRALAEGQLFGGQHPREVELAELICEVVPCAEQVRFNSTGSEAIQAALRIARSATGKKRVVKFEGHYHGWLDNVYVSVAPRRLSEHPGTPIPESEGQITPREEEVTVLPWNDAEAVARELATGDVAAVLMEPVAANHSVILPQPGFLERVRTECNRFGSVLIFDEIITGFRLGLAGAQGRLGVLPDLAVFGKSIASGFPFSCVAGRAELFEGIADGRAVHAGTFNANLTSVAAALATIQTLRDNPDLYAGAEDVGRHLMEGIREARGGRLVVQGLPELFWVGFGEGEVRSVRDLARFDEERTARLSGELVRRGIYVTARGTWYLSGLHSHQDANFAIELVHSLLEAGVAEAL